MPAANVGALVGRDREVELLGRLLEGVRRGATETVVIEGEAGIGKSRLLASLADAAGDLDVTVLRGAGHPLERIRPFGPLVDALELRVGSSDVRRAAIGRLLSGEDAAGAGAYMPGQLQFRVVEEVIDLIEAISDQGPLMLVLDDLHWAEGATLLTVGWVMRRLTAVPLMLVTAVRPAPRSPELIQLLDDAAQLPARFVRLSPLTGRDVDVLSEAELGVPLGRSVVEVVRRCGGNPLWVVELLRALASEGRIDCAGGVAELGAGELPGSVRELVTRRLGYMPETAVKALRTASLLGESFSLMDMAAVTGRRVPELVDDLGPAFAAGLVADHRGVLVFRHQLVRDGIYEAIPEAARIALHRDAADALAAVRAPLEKVASQLVLGAVPPDVEAAAALRRAAGEAAPRAPGVAVDLLRRAEELLPADDPGRDGVLAALAECLVRIGRVPEATAIAEAVLRRPHDEVVDIPLRFALIDALSLQRRGVDLIGHTDAVLTNPQASLADQARALGLSSFGRQFYGDLAGGEAAARHGLEFAERAGDRAMVAWNLCALGGAIRTQGRYAEALEATGRAVEVAFHPPDHQARMRGPNMLHGMVLGDADRLEEAAATLRTAAEECAAVESWYLLADIQLLASEVRLLRGEWDEAVPEIEGGIEFARERGNLITLPRFHAHLAIIAAARGDAAAGEAALGPVAGDLTSESPGYGAEYVFYAAAFVDEVAGQPEAALEHLRRFWEHDALRDNCNGHRFVAPALTRLALGLDRVDVARDAADGAERAAKLGAGVPSVRSAALRCRGLIERDPALMTDAVGLARSSGRVLDLAGACEDAAGVLAACGPATDARALLEQAIDHYEALGATWLGARATASHRSLGGRRGSRGTRSRAQTGWASLTRSERAVAELVSEGLTNRAIGERLFISPHTVNSHLRHAFQKLDVSTRAGLAARVPPTARRTGLSAGRKFT
jgi:DNA-binding CsgD family transcriptional regulator/tetratricopeptide (TPR) repeat protein